MDTELSSGAGVRGLARMQEARRSLYGPELKKVKARRPAFLYLCLITFNKAKRSIRYKAS